MEKNKMLSNMWLTSLCFLVGVVISYFIWDGVNIILNTVMLSIGYFIVGLMYKDIEPTNLFLKWLPAFGLAFGLSIWFPFIAPYAFGLVIGAGCGLHGLKYYKNKEDEKSTNQNK